MDDFNERLIKIENLLAKYLKPNTRYDMDRLEQRLLIIEIQIRDLRKYYFDGLVENNPK